MTAEKPSPIPTNNGGYDQYISSPKVFPPDSQMGGSFKNKPPTPKQAKNVQEPKNYDKQGKKPNIPRSNSPVTAFEDL